MSYIYQATGTNGMVMILIPDAIYEAMLLILSVRLLGGSDLF